MNCPVWGDNAAMIACVGHFRLQAGAVSGYDANAFARAAAIMGRGAGKRVSGSVQRTTASV